MAIMTSRYWCVEPDVYIVVTSSYQFTFSNTLSLFNQLYRLSRGVSTDAVTLTLLSQVQRRTIYLT